MIDKSGVKDKNIVNEECKFSVLMSVYHEENPNYFKEALDSILVSQTLKPNEFVLVVDGPVSNDLNIIINEYEKNNQGILRVYRLESNVGLGKALNYGLNKCTYNLVARADSDDINVPERFQLQINRFKNDNSIDVLGTFIDEFNDDYTSPINYKKMPLEHDELCKMAKQRNPINHMSVMFKKKAIIDAGAYKHLPCLEDYYLWIRVLVSKGKLENLDKYLVHVRVGNGMLHRRSNKEYIPSWKILNKYMKNKKIINSIEHARNILSIYAFIYMPVSLKRIVYKVLLRN
ncbi:glycosyltransferase [Clostridium estertheticum]|uniref:glycosyltransferase n=1 Tax=Clostridium estertheticum TaxID=238834 RepID=UPI001C0E8443|nr:glycosyltransferase [Clostridium estertheticum]MBU3172984.1 glycosyltransferase [Clostridium estertheticum]